MQKRRIPTQAIVIKTPLVGIGKPKLGSLETGTWNWQGEVEKRGKIRPYGYAAVPAMVILCSAYAPSFPLLLAAANVL